MAEYRPAWTWRPVGEDTVPVVRSPLLAAITWDQAFGGSAGRGVRVAVIDSGIDTEHPAVAGAVHGWVEPQLDNDGGVTYRCEPHSDLYGHGTACAGIIHRIAPAAELYSVRVLGRGLSGKGAIFLAGLRWAIEQDMDVVNLSLGTTRQEFAGPLHELADLAYFRRTVLVTAANNLPLTTYPSLFAAAISVASAEGAPVGDPHAFYCNPTPPVEFGAPGIDVPVAWLDGGTIVATGNSFATPHLTGIVALLRAKHPGLTTAEIKTVLRALARNAAPA